MVTSIIIQAYNVSRTIADEYDEIFIKVKLMSPRCFAVCREALPQSLCMSGGMVRRQFEYTWTVLVCTYPTMRICLWLRLEIGYHTLTMTPSCSFQIYKNAFIAFNSNSLNSLCESHARNVWVRALLIFFSPSVCVLCVFTCMCHIYI